MALTFPSSPTDGQLYVDTVTGNRYIYDSGKGLWKYASNNVGMTVGTAPPPATSANPGAMWYNTNTGRTFILYDDGDSKQWVENVPAVGSFDSSTVAGYANAAVLPAVTPAYNTANAAFGKANTALQNTSGTFAGSLTATGDVTSGGTLTALSTVQSSSGADLSLNANGANRDVIMKVNGTELARLVGSTGNLGVGTNNASQKLEVKGSGDTFLRVTGGSGNAKGVEFYKGSGSATQLYNVSDNLIVYNNGINSMTIDSSGRMVRPYQPFARVTHTSQTNISFSNGVGVTVPFNSVQEQIGSNFNTSTYRYTAPVSGTYLITVACQAGGINTSWYNLFIRVNGSNRFGTYMTGLNVGYQPFYTYGITNVTAGDYFDAYIIPNASAGTLELASPDSRNTFCIYFLG